MKRLFLLLIALPLLLCGCGEPNATQTIFAMDTVMTFQVWGKDAPQAVQRISHTISDLESRYNRASLSRGAADPAVLQEALDLSRRTGGAFDPQLGSVTALWNFTAEDPKIPTAEQIRDALQEKTWDLGGALKGYAGQKCVGLLKEMQIDRAILNLGGNVQTYGQKKDGTPWCVGIQNPQGGDPVGILAVEGTASVVTSGDYQRFFEADGVRYHHILDPKTGYPARSGLHSVTVICRDGMTADCLSTALFVMGLEQGSAFWRESQDFEAVFLTEDGKIYATQGASLSGCDYEVIRR